MSNLWALKSANSPGSVRSSSTGSSSDATTVPPVQIPVRHVVHYGQDPTLAVQAGEPIASCDATKIDDDNHFDYPVLEASFEHGTQDHAKK